MYTLFIKVIHGRRHPLTREDRQEIGGMQYLIHVSRPRQGGMKKLIKLARKQSYELNPSLLSFNPLPSPQCCLCSLSQFQLASEQIAFLQLEDLYSVIICQKSCAVFFQFESDFPRFVHSPRLSKDLLFIVKCIWKVKMPDPENVLRKSTAVQTHFCEGLMNYGSSVSL